MNIPSVMDERYKNFLQDIEDYLNSTVVIFYSDHGLREGDFRQTYTGWLEERMPFIYIYLPPSLKAIQPQWHRNLQANKNKLVSAFDLYATLQELLNDRVLQPPPHCHKCVSLLGPVPHNRSCADAAIAPHWCPCSQANSSRSVADTQLVKKMARLATNRINRFLKKSTGHVKNGYHCSKLVFSHIVAARTKNTDSSKQSQTTFVIIFETKPNEAIFEMTRMENARNAIRVEDISRINRYGSQSVCVKDDALLKLFCFCVKDVDQKFPN